MSLVGVATMFTDVIPLPYQAQLQVTSCQLITKQTLNNSFITIHAVFNKRCCSQGYAFNFSTSKTYHKDSIMSYHQIITPKFLELLPV